MIVRTGPHNIQTIIRELPEHVKAGRIVPDGMMTYRLSPEDVTKSYHTAEKKWLC